MQIHQLQPKHSSKNKKRVGRGGKKGTYSGRGGKGQSARAGRKMAPIIRELIKRYPKLKGYRAINLHEEIAIVNLNTLEKNCSDGEVINPENLLNNGIIRAIDGKKPNVKILGKGKLTKKLTIENCKVSESAKKAIESAGGTIKSI